jgi:topoisomerase-4 subunit A
MDEEENINRKNKEEKSLRGHFTITKKANRIPLPKLQECKTGFLDYASYVILERAVPAIEDGFKPVQRRIMHSLKRIG